MHKDSAVIHLLNGEQYSGLERAVDELAEMAPAAGFRLHLVLLKPDTLTSRLRSTRAIVHECPMRGRLDLSVSRRVARLAREVGAVLVHSHTVRSALVAAVVQRCTGLPWVHHVHSPALHDSERPARNLTNFLAEAVVVRRANAVMCVSESLSTYVKRSYSVAEHRLAVVPNGVAAQPSSQFPARGDRCKIVATVGLFRPRKGIEHLIDAGRLLIDAGHQVRFRLIGEFADDAYKERLKRQVTSAKLTEHVEFVGFVNDPQSELAASDVFAFPSLYGEGLPMAVLEAMALGRPIVASNISGVNELLDGNSGLLVRPGSASDLARAIARVLQEGGLAQRLSRRATERLNARYSLAAMGDSVFGTYDRLLLLAKSRQLPKRLVTPSVR